MQSIPRVDDGPEFSSFYPSRSEMQQQLCFLVSNGLSSLEDTSIHDLFSFDLALLSYLVYRRSTFCLLHSTLHIRFHTLSLLLFAVKFESLQFIPFNAHYGHDLTGRDVI